MGIGCSIGEIIDLYWEEAERAGLDYWHLLDIDYWDDIRDLFEAYKDNPKYFLTSKAAKGYTQVNYDPESLLVFGRETSGLPDSIHEAFPEQCLRIPMIPDPKARCLNLSNAVAVVVYEAFRQQPGFGGAQPGAHVPFGKTELAV